MHFKERKRKVLPSHMRVLPSWRKVGGHAAGLVYGGVAGFWSVIAACNFNGENKGKMC